MIDRINKIKKRVVNLTRRIEYFKNKIKRNVKKDLNLYEKNKMIIEYLKYERRLCYKDLENLEISLHHKQENEFNESKNF